MMYEYAYHRAYGLRMGSEKIRSEYSKARGSFCGAVVVFQDDRALTIEDQHSDEERFIRLGMDAKERILVVVYTWREECVRIISARQATPREREKYER